MICLNNFSDLNHLSLSLSPFLPLSLSSLSISPLPLFEKKKKKKKTHFSSLFFEKFIFFIFFKKKKLKKNFNKNLFLQNNSLFIFFFSFSPPSSPPPHTYLFLQNLTMSQKPTQFWRENSDKKKREKNKLSLSLPFFKSISEIFFLVWRERERERARGLL